MPMYDITHRLSEFKSSGLIADYEVMVADDSVRVRLVAPRGQDAAKVKSFVVETLAGKLSESQVSVDEATK
jgi:fructose 1,6-bisphosphatase